MHFTYTFMLSVITICALLQARATLVALFLMTLPVVTLLRLRDRSTDPRWKSVYTLILARKGHGPSRQALNTAMKKAV